MKTRIHAFVKGRVQGVFFRANTKKVAMELDLKGFVKNLSDGRVEIVAEGKEGNINEFMKFLKKGPESAKVTDFDIKKEKYSGEFARFEIRY